MGEGQHDSVTVTFRDQDGTTRLQGELFGENGLTALPVSVATKTLTDAQVKALPTTAVTLLAAPGTGFALVPIHATVRLAWAVDYTNIDAAARLFINVGSSEILARLDEAVLGAISNLLAGGEDANALMPAVGFAPASASPVPFNGSSGFFDGDIENRTLNISATNAAAGDFTGGDAANVLKVTLLYYTVTF